MSGQNQASGPKVCPKRPDFHQASGPIVRGPRITSPLYATAALRAAVSTRCSYFDRPASGAKSWFRLLSSGDHMDEKGGLCVLARRSSARSLACGSLENGVRVGALDLPSRRLRSSSVATRTAGH